MNIVTQSISSQASYNYDTKMNNLAKQKQVSKYVNPQFRGGEQFIKTGVETVAKDRRILPKILIALGMTKLAYSIYTKPFKKELQLMQADIDRKSNEMKQRKNFQCTKFYRGDNCTVMSACRDNLNGIIELEQKILSNFMSAKGKKTLTKDEIYTKFTELQTSMSNLNEKYINIDDAFKLLENERYEELVNKELKARKLIDEYKSLAKEYEALDNITIRDEESDKKLEIINAQIESIKNELSNLKEKKRPIDSLQEKKYSEYDLQKMKTPVIKEKFLALNNQIQSEIDKIMQENGMEEVVNKIDVKKQELEKLENEKAKIEKEASDKRWQKRKELEAKKSEISEQKSNAYWEFDSIMGYTLGYHPYYVDNSSHLKSYPIPEWITTPNGERPFTVINDTSDSFDSEEEASYPYGYMKTVTEYVGGESLG